MSNTEINQQYFSVVLPGSWQAVASGEDGLWVYEAGESGERLTVSVLLAGDSIAHDQVHEMFEQFCRQRRRDECAAAPGLNLTDVSVTRLDGATTGFYAGEDESGRRVANFSIVNRAGVANFCHEAFGLDADVFADRSYEILGQVGFIDPQ